MNSINNTYTYLPIPASNYLLDEIHDIRKLTSLYQFQTLKKWTTLLGDNILFPGHYTVIYLLKSSTTSENASSLNYFLAKNLLSPSPPSIIKALDLSNLYRQVWLDSYNEDKQSLIDHEVYEMISKSQCLDLKRAVNTPKDIPLMCILVVKNDTNGKPLRSKYCIVILGNFKYRLY